MYFKRLELFGFKSFADRTRLDFEPGITAVVGPNGCGKSNIADAIKWVLGEQSAKMLRGGKMEDIIFNGTDGKEPVNYAEVSLTLANHDRTLPIEYDEVTVTRRLYRSGESEYLLNKTQVRLKDINEMFMGTGIGTSAYSLIEQGRIGQILSSRPEDRREVFEEASGITRYKSKKREALRRLDDTEQNLLRLNDIISEVKRQINSIERQARKAERYKEKYEELKELELKLSRIDLEALKEKLSGSVTNIEEYKTKEGRLSNEIQKLTAELSELNSSRSEVENNRMDFKSGLVEIDSDISNSTHKISLDRERIEELKGRRAELEEEIRKGEENVSSQRNEVESLRSQVNVLQTEDTHRVNLLKEKETRLEELLKLIEENETLLSTSKANLIDIASREAKLRNQSAKVSANISSDGARLERLETEKGTIEEEKKELDLKLLEIENQIGTVGHELDGLKSEKNNVSAKISALNVRIEELNGKTKILHKDMSVYKSKLEVLEEARAKYEGYSSGVKSLLGRPEGTWNPMVGIRDVLANLLSVKEGYELAVESALGDNLQSIIVDDITAAERAISFLRENSCGKATFLCPDRFADTPRRGDTAQDHRILGRALDFISADEKYAGILRYLLGKTLVVKDLNDALALSSEGAFSDAVFVTLAGELAGKGFASGGDNTKEGTTLINREAKIKELSEKVSVLEKDFQSMEEERLKDEEERGETEKKLEDISLRLNEQEILLSNSKTRKTNMEENIKGVSDELSLLHLELDEVNAELERLRNEDVSIKSELSRTEEDMRLNETRIRDSEKLVAEHSREREGLLVNITQEKTEIASLESKKDGLSNTLNILEGSLGDAELGVSSRKRELENSIKKVDELSAEIVELENKINALTGEKNIKGTELQSVEKEYSSLMEKIKHNEGIFRQFEKELSALRSELHEVDLKKAETNYSVNNLKQRIRDVYKIDLDEISIEDNWKDTEKEFLEKEVDEKRAKLDSMGPVNLVAIEEHTELQDRFAFLTHQRDDLLKAKDSLLKAIAKINKTTRDLFIETFNNIHAEFQNFFKMLFGGGHGELILLDEQNVLESGIEIVARPPGKKLQNVSLLSGGEKALTAISLIFAIFKVKPSPFCVLDEIDAPLDESNVDRFSRSLSLFTDTSQFIVITHNKKTIDMSDVMYGITMQQSGVSKVVSVKFSDTKKEEPARN